jgi:hypothetical protein
MINNFCDLYKPLLIRNQKWELENNQVGAPGDGLKTGGTRSPNFDQRSSSYWKGIMKSFIVAN